MLIAAYLAALLLPVPIYVGPASAQAGCTGENCPPPAPGGHECESKKDEQTTS